MSRGLKSCKLDDDYDDDDDDDEDDDEDKKQKLFLKRATARQPSPTPSGATAAYTYTRLGIYVSDDKVIFILRGTHFLCENFSLYKEQRASAGQTVNSVQWREQSILP